MEGWKYKKLKAGNGCPGKEEATYGRNHSEDRGKIRRVVCEEHERSRQMR
jgi:hypothetical protein